jgi:adenine nucleotide transporter 17
VTTGTASADGKIRKIKPSAIEAAKAIYKQDGIQGFWRGIGPALILVINPVIQVRTTSYALNEAEE